MLRVGLIGLGAMGRMHFDCWRKCPSAQLVAISARDPKKLAGEWGDTAFNLGDQAAAKFDLTGIATYADALDLINDSSIDVVDICTATPQHSPLAIAALRAGKHVFCEKPMALTLDDCSAMIDFARESNRRLAVGHCLRYWPHYVKAKEMIESGTYGRPLHASFHRISALPVWSSGGWLGRASESGGVILDMHIHDVDVALWWFGQPESVKANGHCREGLPLIVEASWNYPEGPIVQLHSAWDPNGGEFTHGFRLIMEKATLVYDLLQNGGALQMHEGGKTTIVPLDEPNAHQAEIDDFAASIIERRPLTRLTSNDSRNAVAVALDELRQVMG